MCSYDPDLTGNCACCIYSVKGTDLWFVNISRQLQIKYCRKLKNDCQLLSIHHNNLVLNSSKRQQSRFRTQRLNCNLLYAGHNKSHCTVCGEDLFKQAVEVSEVHFNTFCSTLLVRQIIHRLHSLSFVHSSRWLNVHMTCTVCAVITGAFSEYVRRPLLQVTDHEEAAQLSKDYLVV